MDERWTFADEEEGGSRSLEMKKVALHYCLCESRESGGGMKKAGERLY